MPEFVVSPKYKAIFNDYDLSVIKAAHVDVPRQELLVHRSRFLERLRNLDPNFKVPPAPRQETIQKVEGLSDNDFCELMSTFRYV
jgi:hypothetical protein